MDNPAQLKTQGLMQKSSRLLLLASALIFLLIIAAVGMYAWFFVYNPCEVEAVKEATTMLVTQFKNV